MNQRVAIGVMIASILAGLLGVFYGLSQALSDEPSKIVYVQSGSGDVQTANAETVSYDRLLQQVAPLSGTTITVNWGDMGQKLIESGAIDLEEFQAHYGSLSEEQQAILLGDELTEITFKPENIQFWTNVLWALGLVQESKVLGEGPIKQREDTYPIGGYASTGGWTLGSQPAE